jgi:lysyl-tRNA synthetase class 2
MKEPIKPEVNILKFRHRAKDYIRKFLDHEGFLEIDTPYLLLANTPDPFIDPINAETRAGKIRSFQLHTSPEIWLKKVLSQNISRIYHMGRVFRDDPISPIHNREFTMLEWYRAHEKISCLIKDCQEIFDLAYRAGLESGLNIKKIPDFIEYDLETLFKDLAGLDLPDILKKSKKSNTYFQNFLKDRECLPKNASFSDAFFHIMVKYIEPNLPFDHPTVIRRWPIELAALAAACEDDPMYCDRFEIYYRGVELANAYQECTDPEVIRARFIRENQERALLNKPVFAIDESFLLSLSKLPQSAGIAMGIDRLFLTVAQKSDLSQIVLGALEK